MMTKAKRIRKPVEFVTAVGSIKLRGVYTIRFRRIGRDGKSVGNNVDK